MLERLSGQGFACYIIGGLTADLGTSGEHTLEAGTVHCTGKDSVGSDAIFT
ncbi:hypothetical protein D3C84_1095060 [compost metagenome]